MTQPEIRRISSTPSGLVRALMISVTPMTAAPVSSVRRAVPVTATV